MMKEPLSVSGLSPFSQQLRSFLMHQSSPVVHEHLQSYAKPPSRPSFHRGPFQGTLGQEVGSVLLALLVALHEQCERPGYLEIVASLDPVSGRV